MKVLVTGGAGYIGSHTVIELLAAGMVPIIADNFSNSHPDVLRRIEQISGVGVKSYDVNVCNTKLLDDVFVAERPDAVIHFAALKAVGESVGKPLAYYRNNVLAVINVAELMAKHGVRNLVFSSSATVYGDPEHVPIPEIAVLDATNPYGWTKLMGEQILRDVALADDKRRITLLRYFNPVGAHKSGLIGEDPLGMPNNIMPMIAQVATGQREYLKVFGNDYPTRDGTGVRDYIHVVDLAKAHVKALQHQDGTEGIDTYNLGAGKGYSVMEIIAAFEKASGKTIPYRVVERRPGDVAMCFADTTLAKTELGWETTKNLAAMCEDAWRWQSNNIVHGAA